MGRVRQESAEITCFHNKAKTLLHCRKSFCNAGHSEFELRKKENVKDVTSLKMWLRFLRPEPRLSKKKEFFLCGQSKCKRSGMQA